MNGIGRVDTSAIDQDISDFSSTGKTRDGRIKPDLTAPGERVLGAVSKDAYPGVSPTSIYQYHPFPEVDALITDSTPGHTYGALQGTSFSAPVVAGLAARVLSTNSTLDAIEVRNVLINSAVTDGFTGAVPNDLWGYGKASLTVGGAPLPKDLRITADTLPSGVRNQQYNFVLTASGGTLPYAWFVTGGALPDGLSLENGGFLTGKPHTAGTYSFTIQACDGSAPQQTDSRSYQVAISANPPLHITKHSHPVAKIGKAYTSNNEAEGGTAPYTWTLAGGALPPGLNLNADGSITGTATTLGKYSFTVRVQDAAAGADLRCSRIRVLAQTEESWMNLGTQAQKINQVAVDPNDPNHIAASVMTSYFPAAGAIFESTNGGDSWKDITTNNDINCTADQLGFSPLTSNLWAISAWLYRYDTAAGLWTNQGLTGRAVTFDFDAADSIYLTTGASGYPYYQSVNQGGNWTLVSTSGCLGTGGPIGFERMISVFRSNPNYVYSKTCRSEDGGQNWVDVVNNSSGQGINSAHVSQTNFNDVVKVSDWMSAVNVWRTTDGGRNWTRYIAVTPGSNVDSILIRSLNDPSYLLIDYQYSDYYMQPPTGLLKSHDSGMTWTPMSMPGNGATAATIALDPADDNRLYVGTDQGLFLSQDGGASYLSIGSGLTLRTLLGLSISPVEPNLLLLLGSEGPSVHVFVGGALGPVKDWAEQPEHALAGHVPRGFQPRLSRQRQWDLPLGKPGHHVDGAKPRLQRPALLSWVSTRIPSTATS